MVAWVSVTPETVTLSALGETVQLSATAFDETGIVISDAGFEWSSSDPSVVAVDPAGLATALANGGVQVEATAQGITGAAAVAVVQTVSVVTVSPTATTLEPGEQTALAAAATDGGGHPVSDVTFSWASSDESVVTVAPDATVTAVGSGEAEVTATAEGVESDPVAVSVTSPATFTCTHVIGFSQTHDWFSAGFEAVVDTERWQEMWRPGGAINFWADPDFDGWSQPVLSPCVSDSGSPDRVLLTISADFQPDVSWWTGHIRTVIGHIRTKYPSAREIVLQPVIGGPNHAQCSPNGVRASQNHPIIDDAIAVVAGGDVVSGFSPEVRTCADYRDFVGHLNSPGSAAAATTIGAFYAR